MMARRWVPRSVAGWTIAVFGVMAVLFGVFGLGSPETVLAMLGFEVLDPAARVTGDHTRTFMAAASMASFNMGVYYLLAAATEWRVFFRFTVAFRLLTWLVFSALVLLDVAPGRFVGVALWEAIGAVATGLALAYERRVSAGRSAAGQ